MQKTMKVKSLAILVSCLMLMASCKNFSLFNKKKDKSEVTGWNYNDKNMGGFQVAKAKDQQTGRTCLCAGRYVYDGSDR
jgi:hypothetical protein